jgi:ribonucleotide reductase alpha subunit
MCSYEDRLRVVRLYIKYGKRAMTVIRELGVPSRNNLRHHPVGLGMMGFQDCLHQMRVPFGSQAAVDFADASSEAVCYNAYQASSDLAVERGRYSTFKGSLWDRGILPPGLPRAPT